MGRARRRGRLTYRLSLSLGSYLLVAALSPIAATAQTQITELSQFTWRSDEPDLGGISSVEVADDGITFVAVSDRALIFHGRFERGDDGQIVGAEVTKTLPLLEEDGEPVVRYRVDSEGLARAEDGAAYLSFEAEHRVAKVDLETGVTTDLKTHPGFADMQNNSSLEVLAVDAAGHLYTLPERSGSLDVPFKVYRYAPEQGWTVFGTLPRTEKFLPVGADFGPDGKLYVLERQFTGVNFASRIARYERGEGRFENPEELLRSTPGQYDNLEGISATPAGDAIRLTMISDDNYSFFQKTEWVEYLVNGDVSAK